jgi:hypothetical protein
MPCNNEVSILVIQLLWCLLARNYWPTIEAQIFLGSCSVTVTDLGINLGGFSSPSSLSFSHSSSQICRRGFGGGGLHWISSGRGGLTSARPPLDRSLSVDKHFFHQLNMICVWGGGGELPCVMTLFIWHCVNKLKSILESTIGVWYLSIIVPSVTPRS